ncbi:hypothetical protein OSH11_11585 [Kaistia dalseonensis]|uniref:Sialate O-acetylesterase domain-containing protein n=1 Tax=Kaistia dalseonensis TaxID=410840 RepID=A0ABU0H7D3_9HYPH|nr:hypothetical protein [Kaistia dalseonensis]MCX5495351.1 hypothetical protein [Kaistia dalseonensis]MDQ0437937.1 hypothetical protein [Kaistia dalseonensis]
MPGIGLGLGLWLSSTVLSTPVITPVAPFAATVAPMACWSLRRVNPSYAGNCLMASGDVATTNVAYGFAAAGKDALINGAALDALYTANPTNTELRCRTLYDQATVGPYNLVSTASTTGQRVKRVSEGVGGSPGLRALAQTQGLTTNSAASTGPFNIGGATDNLTVILSLAICGWGAAAPFGTSTPGSASNAAGTALGFGASTSEFLSLAETDDINSGEAVYGSVCILRDEINAMFERSTSWNRLRTIALKFEGQKVTGYMGQTKCFSYTMSFSALTGVRLWLGCASGPVASANAEIKEAIVYNAALSDNEILSIMKEVGTFWGALGGPIETLDTNLLLWGQSEIGWLEQDGWSLLRAELASLLGGSPAVHRIPTQANNFTAFGGSASQQGSVDTGSASNYWRVYPLVAGAPGRGPNGTTAYNAVSAYATKNRRTIAICDWGQQDAAALGGVATAATNTVGNPLYGTATKAGFKQAVKDELDDLEAALGHPVAAVIYNLLHLQTPAGSYAAGWETVRQAQIELAAESNGKILLLWGANDATLRDYIHYDTTFIQTKWIKRIARKAANVAKPSLGLVDRGPRFVSASFTDGTKTGIRVAIAHVGGTDISPSTGISGFRVVDTGGVKTIASAIRETATTMLVSLSASCVGATTIQLPYGTDYDLANYPVDNASGVNWPVEGFGPVTVT